METKYIFIYSHSGLVYTVRCFSDTDKMKSYIKRWRKKTGPLGDSDDILFFDVDKRGVATEFK